MPSFITTYDLIEGVKEILPEGQAINPDDLALLEKLKNQIQSAVGKDHSATINCMRVLGRAHSIEGDHQTAVSVLKSALDLQKAKLDDQDRRLHLTKNELAQAYSRSGHPERALPIDEELAELATLTDTGR